MPRRPNVTMNELEDLIDATSGDAAKMQDAADRIHQGYCDKPERMAAKVVALNATISAASALLGALTQKIYLAELKAETEAMIVKRADDRALAE